MCSLGANYHMHTNFCDGKDMPEEYVLAALDRNMYSIGFSAHVPVPFFSKFNMPVAKLEPYFVEIARLKNRYAGQIEIYVGFEMDYVGLVAEELYQRYINRVDYTIGSVHYIYHNGTYHSIEGSKELVADTFKLVGDPRKCVEIYYSDLIKVVRDYRPNIVGHLDVIKKRNTNNCYFDPESDWYMALVRKLLDAIKAAGSIVELNTGGMIRGFLEEFYPSDLILQECNLRSIPVIISSDAHRAHDIDGLFEVARDKLLAFGFSQRKILKSGLWLDVGL